MRPRAGKGPTNPHFEKRRICHDGFRRSETQWRNTRAPGNFSQRHLIALVVIALVVVALVVIVLIALIALCAVAPDRE